MSEQAADERKAGGIGARLAAARARCGMSVLQAAEKLHVDARIIEALESERFEELGAAVFVRGHIRRYAELVDESAPDLQALYGASSHAVRPPDLTRVPKSEPAGSASSLRAPGIAIVLAVALIGSAWWVAGSLKAPPPRTNASLTEPRGVAAPVAQGPSSSGPATPSPSREPMAPGAMPPAATVAAHVSVPVPAADSGSSGAVSPGPQPVRTRPTELTLHFTQDSWAEVYDAHGEKLFYDVGTADSTHALTGAAPLRVVLGNATGVALEVNGHAVALPAAERDASVQFRVTRGGRVLPAAAAAVTPSAQAAATGKDSG